MCNTFSQGCGAASFRHQPGPNPRISRTRTSFRSRTSRAPPTAGRRTRAATGCETRALHHRRRGGPLGRPSAASRGARRGASRSRAAVPRSAPAPRAAAPPRWYSQQHVEIRVLKTALFSLRLEHHLRQPLDTKPVTRFGPTQRLVRPSTRVVVDRPHHQKTDGRHDHEERAEHRPPNGDRHDPWSPLDHALEAKPEKPQRARLSYCNSDATT